MQMFSLNLLKINLFRGEFYSLQELYPMKKFIFEVMFQIIIIPTQPTISKDSN